MPIITYAWGYLPVAFGSVVDGALVIGYLTAALIRGARHVADQTIESLLERLVKLVEHRLGRRPLDDLERAPASAEVQAQIRCNLHTAMDTDPAFAGELATVIAQLDQHGARSLINQVEARINVQAFERSVAVGRDLTYLNAPDPTNLSGAPGWTKICIVLGVVFKFLAVFVAIYAGFEGFQDAEYMFGVMVNVMFLALLGAILLAAGVLGRLMSPRR